MGVELDLEADGIAGHADHATNLEERFTPRSLRPETSAGKKPHAGCEETHSPINNNHPLSLL
jgi:hypothetical protein